MDTISVLDQYRLNFSEGGLLVLNITLAIIMFGVALGIDLNNFKKIAKNPKSVILGLISQVVLLPIVTFILIYILQPSTSIALGMILVASCPGGNISNFISSLAKANVELSVSLTAVSDIASIIVTPLNFAFWGALYATSSNLLVPIEIDIFHMFQTVFIILGIPLVLGVLFAKKFPEITAKIVKPLKIASIVIFGGYVVVALANNFSLFLQFIHVIFLIVLAHNALALLTGYTFASIFRLNLRDRRTLSIETGIQNSGLALVLIFNPSIFPPELQIGGMAFIAAWWGIWHILSGMGIAFFWSRKIKP